MHAVQYAERTKNPKQILDADPRVSRLQPLERVARDP
jgi:hypothetical protein